MSSWSAAESREIVGHAEKVTINSTAIPAAHAQVVTRRSHTVLRRTLVNSHVARGVRRIEERRRAYARFGTTACSVAMSRRSNRATDPAVITRMVTTSQIWPLPQRFNSGLSASYQVNGLTELGQDNHS